MKRIIFFAAVLVTALAQAQTGINTDTPQKTLHVNGSLQITNELNLGGDAQTQGTAGSAGQVLTSNGPDEAPSWQTQAIPEIPSSTVGSVIALDGQLVIAQEITVQMSSDYTKPKEAEVSQICNLDVVIVDNENMYTGTATGNTFKVSSDGVYLIMMNMQLEAKEGHQPVMGIWDNEADNWIARVNDKMDKGLETFTLITAIEMKASKTYSFRVAGGADKLTVKSHSSGTTGSGPVSQVTVRRIK